ncbi:MAG: hypothetical protein MUP16_11360, partial [Sedimentisphaerales bacterium]|nr:hypothetical protein [Sedimentisphaerales bacterium]
GFRAVEGLEPIKLPDTVGVMNLRIRTNHSDADVSDDEPVDNDNKINDIEELRDTTTFSIIFSPSGKLVIHDVRVRNRDGERDTSPTKSYDDVFNKRAEVNTGIGMFVQDDYPGLGFDEEPSRNSFRIYDKTVFEKLNPLSRYNDYLKDLEVVYINPYTGTMIEK